MIRLTEVFWEKGMDNFGTRPVSVNVDHILRMSPSVTTLSGTYQYMDIVFNGKTPDKYRKTIASMNVTEIRQSDGSTIDVQETLDEIDRKIYEESHYGLESQQDIHLPILDIE